MIRSPLAPMLLVASLALVTLAWAATHDVTYTMVGTEDDWLGALAEDADARWKDKVRLEARAAAADARFRDSALRFYRATQAVGKPAYGGTINGITSVTLTRDDPDDPTSPVASLRVEGD